MNDIPRVEDVIRERNRMYRKIDRALGRIYALLMGIGGGPGDNAADSIIGMVQRRWPRQPGRAGYHKKPIPAKLRWEVFKRDGFKCLVCGTQDDLQIDHIQPESQGGSTTLDNLQTHCRSCNLSKGRR